MADERVEAETGTGCRFRTRTLGRGATFERVADLLKIGQLAQPAAGTLEHHHGPGGSDPGADRREPQRPGAVEAVVGLSGEIDDVAEVGADDKADEHEDRTECREPEEDQRPRRRRWEHPSGGEEGERGSGGEQQPRDQPREREFEGIGADWSGIEPVRKPATNTTAPPMMTSQSAVLNLVKSMSRRRHVAGRRDLPVRPDPPATGLYSLSSPVLRKSMKAPTVAMRAPGALNQIPMPRTTSTSTSVPAMSGRNR